MNIAETPQTSTLNNKFLENHFIFHSRKSELLICIFMLQHFLLSSAAIASVHRFNYIANNSNIYKLFMVYINIYSYNIFIYGIFVYVLVYCLAQQPCRPAITTGKATNNTMFCRRSPIPFGGAAAKTLQAHSGKFHTFSA